jgi:hypothetical protein
MREVDLQNAIIDAARHLGYLVFHPQISLRSTPGFPDLTIVHPRTGTLIFAELKGTGRKPTAAQDVWLRALAGTAAEVFLWRPQDWPDGVMPWLIRGARG